MDQKMNVSDQVLVTWTESEPQKFLNRVPDQEQEKNTKTDKDRNFWKFMDLVLRKSLVKSGTKKLLS